MESITTEELLFQLRAIATADATEFLQVTGGNLTVTDTDRLTPLQRAAVASLEKGTGGIKVKLYDKLKALELLIRLLGLGEAALAPPENTLLEAIARCTGEVIDTHDLPELQQAPEDGAVLVEPA